jgi:Arc/MetJ family transcription regulator
MARIVIDDELIDRVLKVTGLPTKNAAVEAGLRMLLQVAGQEGIRRLRGKVKWEGNLGETRQGRVDRSKWP